MGGTLCFTSHAHTIATMYATRMAHMLVSMHSAQWATPALSLHLPHSFTVEYGCAGSMHCEWMDNVQHIYLPVSLVVYSGPQTW
jgi:hypothetical protein